MLLEQDWWVGVGGVGELDGGVGGLDDGVGARDGDSALQRGSHSV